VWGTWWGDATEPKPRQGAAGSLPEAQRAAIAAGLQMVEHALRALPDCPSTSQGAKKNSCHRSAEEGRLSSQSLWFDASFDRYRRS